MAEEMQFSEEELAELRGMFFAQAAEVVESLGEQILRVERDPADAESLRAIRRAVHTLKGDSAAFGFAELTALAHHYEDALDSVRARQGGASRALINLLLAGADCLAALLAHYRGEGAIPDTSALVRGLEELSREEGEGEAGGEVAGSPLPFGHAETAEPDAPAPAEAYVGEERRSGGERRAGLDRRQGQTPATTLRVESEKIDAAMNLVGELIIQRSMVSTLAAQLEAERPGDDRARRLAEAVALSGRTLSELQESVMRMRLVPIDQVFRRFQRVVRDASVKMCKPLRLEVEGGQTEIDKSVVEQISDPLIHLVRNACDHGVEPAEKRAAAGKPAEGVIRLSARRAGNQIEVEVADDGSGIDAERVAATAVARGLVGPREVAEWGEQQKLSLIFLPGLSTKEQVSDMSGRGVGMDVVKTTVDGLGGSVAVSTARGKGSRFIIRLPLTMAIVRAMLFDCAGRRFALPLDSVSEITSLRAGERHSVGGREVMRLRDRVLPLVSVGEALGIPAACAGADVRRFVFVVELGDGRDVGLVVDRLRGEQELVLKSVDDPLTRTPLVAGASILGDGGVVLILDAGALVREAAPTEG